MMIPNAIEIAILILCIILIVALMKVHAMTNFLAKLRPKRAAANGPSPTQTQIAPSSKSSEEPKA